MGKLNTPRRLMPSVRVVAMRPISSGGTVVERRVLQRSNTSCMFIVFQAMTRLASKLNASATACISLLLGLVAGHATDVDRALQGIDRLCAIEHAQQFTSKCLVDEIIGQEHSAQQSSQLRQGFVQRISPSGSAKARQHLNRTGVPAVDGGDKVHNLPPLRRNLCQVNIGVADRSQDLGNVPVVGQEQV